uniref:Uncharacterized protein n=1 Tax=Meloidogyne enterolobii TaxID=390850 RepID=A0A6V7XJ30_MELEN|nr:unnamed protein product [Meloidogyne enterolobii]
MAPTRIRKYKELLPWLALPPQQVLTRWSSWLNAANFYADNFNAIKQVVDAFDSEDAVCIRKSKELFNNLSISHQLAYIKSNFTIISKSIIELQDNSLTIMRVFEIVSEIKETLSLAEGDVRLSVQNKFNSILQKKPWT